MRKLSIVIIGSVLSTMQMHADSINMYGSPDKDNPYKWSDSTNNQPWAGGNPTTDIALWKGTDGSIQAPGYILVDNDYYLNQIKVSGGGGAGSNLNLIFDDTVSSSLSFSNGKEAFNLNSHYLDINLSGKGTVNYDATGISELFTYSNNSNASTFTIGENITVQTKENLLVNGHTTGGVNVVHVNGIVQTKENGYFTTTDYGKKTINIYGAKAEMKYANFAFDATSVNIYDGGKLTATGEIKLRGSANVVSGVNSTITADNLLIGNDNSDASISSGSKLSIGGIANISSIYLYKGNEFVVTEGATLTANYLELSKNVNAGVDTTVGITKTTINGTVNVENGILTQVLANLKVSNTGKLNVANGKIHISYSSTKNQDTFVIESSGNDIKADFYLPMYAGLRVYGDNTWSKSSILVRGDGAYLTVGNNSTLTLESLLWANGKSKDFILTVEEGSTLIIEDFTGSLTYDDSTFMSLGMTTDNSLLDLATFNEKSILFKTIGSDEENAKFLSKVYLNRNEIENLRFSDYDSVAGGYWLTAVTVPEPAEYAMILGALALGLTIYRRRK